MINSIAIAQQQNDDLSKRREEIGSENEIKSAKQVRSLSLSLSIFNAESDEKKIYQQMLGSMKSKPLPSFLTTNVALRSHGVE